MPEPVPPPPGGSQEHQPLPAEITINAGTLGLITTIAKVIAGLTTDKALTLFVAGAFGYMLFTTMQQANVDKQNTARLYEENRTNDRAHCDAREDKLARDFAAETEKLRVWFAAQGDAQRRFEVEQRERDRAAVAELTRVITKRFPAANECPP